MGRKSQVGPWGMQSPSSRTFGERSPICEYFPFFRWASPLTTPQYAVCGGWQTVMRRIPACVVFVWVSMGNEILRLSGHTFFCKWLSPKTFGQKLCTMIHHYLFLPQRINLNFMKHGIAERFCGNFGFSFLVTQEILTISQANPGSMSRVHPRSSFHPPCSCLQGSGEVDTAEAGAAQADSSSTGGPEPAPKAEEPIVTTSATEVLFHGELSHWDALLPAHPPLFFGFTNIPSMFFLVAMLQCCMFQSAQLT